MKHWIFHVVGLFFLGTTIPAFGAALDVAAGIPPVAFLVERIGGDHVRVETLIQPGQDPHTFEITPKQMQKLSRATLFLKVGMPFEEQVLEKLRAVRPELTVIDTARGIRKILLVQATTHDHSEAEEDHLRHHGDEDTHVWLSPPNVKIQAAQIAVAMQKADSGHAELFQKNLVKLQADLDAVHARNLKRLKPFAGRTFYVFHPAFGYFASCYGLKQAAIETGGKTPSTRQLRQIIQRAKTDGVKVIFLQPQFNPQNAQAVAQALGAKVTPLNDLSKDVIANLDELGVKIESALKQPPSN
jgi:zinc transport system substrate-binding protein